MARNPKCSQVKATERAKRWDLAAASWRARPGPLGGPRGVRAAGGCSAGTNARAHPSLRAAKRTRSGVTHPGDRAGLGPEGGSRVPVDQAQLHEAVESPGVALEGSVTGVCGFPFSGKTGQGRCFGGARPGALVPALPALHMVQCTRTRRSPQPGATCRLATVPPHTGGQGHRWAPRAAPKSHDGGQGGALRESQGRYRQLCLKGHAGDRPARGAWGPCHTQRKEH